MEGFFHYILRRELDCHFVLLFWLLSVLIWNFYGHWILPWFWGCAGEIQHRTTVREGSAGSPSLLPAFSTEDKPQERKAVHRHPPASFMRWSLRQAKDRCCGPWGWGLRALGTLLHCFQISSVFWHFYILKLGSFHLSGFSFLVQNCNTTCHSTGN